MKKPGSNQKREEEKVKAPEAQPWSVVIRGLLPQPSSLQPSHWPHPPMPPWPPPPPTGHGSGRHIPRAATARPTHHTPRPQRRRPRKSRRPSATAATLWRLWTRRQQGEEGQRRGTRRRVGHQNYCHAGRRSRSGGRLWVKADAPREKKKKPGPAAAGASQTAPRRATVACDCPPLRHLEEGNDRKGVAVGQGARKAPSSPRRCRPADNRHMKKNVPSGRCGGSSGESSLLLPPSPGADRGDGGEVGGRVPLSRKAVSATKKNSTTAAVPCQRPERNKAW